MNFNLNKFNRYVTFQTPTDTNTKGSVSRSWADTFSSYAQMADDRSGTSEITGARITENKSTWKFPYNSAIVKDGRFYEGNATTLYYYVVGVSETIYQTEMTVEAELRV